MYCSVHSTLPLDENASLGIRGPFRPGGGCQEGSNQAIIESRNTSARSIVRTSLFVETTELLKVVFVKVSWQCECSKTACSTVGYSTGNNAIAITQKIKREDRTASTLTASKKIVKAKPLPPLLLRTLVANPSPPTKITRGTTYQLSQALCLETISAKRKAFPFKLTRLSRAPTTREKNQRPSIATLSLRPSLAIGKVPVLDKVGARNNFQRPSITTLSPTPLPRVFDRNPLPRFHAKKHGVISLTSSLGNVGARRDFPRFLARKSRSIR